MIKPHFVSNLVVRVFLIATISLKCHWYHTDSWNYANVKLTTGIDFFLRVTFTTSNLFIFNEYPFQTKIWEIN